MKKILVGTLAALSVLVLGAPAGATNGEPVGARINLRTGTPTTYPANTAFNIRHGWFTGAISPAAALGIYDFKLDVDGVPRGADFIVREAVPPFVVDSDDAVLVLNWVFNFPDGMTAGTHTFTGHWIAPCQTAVEFAGYPGPCATPTAPVETETHSLTVTFTP